MDLFLWMEYFLDWVPSANYGLFPEWPRSLGLMCCVTSGLVWFIVAAFYFDFSKQLLSDKCSKLFLYSNPLDGVANESNLEDFMFNFYTNTWSSPNRDEF